MVLPFYIVTLTHPWWEEALACAKRLPPDALPELRLDCFPELDPAEAVAVLGRRCLVSCRRREEGGAFEGGEAARLAHLARCLPARPAWVDLEWDVEIAPAFQEARSHVRLLRSVHVSPGVWDLGKRLAQLPPGDAFKWVGHAAVLADNQRLKEHLAWARDHQVRLSAFLLGNKGEASRCLQAVWGGAFTYAAPDDGPPAAPGQLPLSYLRQLRAHKLHKGYGLCGVLGSPLKHSPSPAFHNAAFQRAFKDLVYLRLETDDPQEAVEALHALDVQGASVTAPLKHTFAKALGLPGPLNTLWRVGQHWASDNTDLQALSGLLPEQGPVLLLGGGGVAHTSRCCLESRGLACLQASRRCPVSPEAVRQHGPVGVIQATTLGMGEGDPLPFPSLLEAAKPTLQWAVEWVSHPETAFAHWARDCGLHVIEGATLFYAQAALQSQHFLGRC